MAEKSLPSPAMSTPAPDTSLSSSGPTSSGPGNANVCEMTPMTSTEAPSPEAEVARQQIDGFFSKSYKLKNWVTANGYGAFDLNYEPTSAACVITVNLEFDFQDAPPSVLLQHFGDDDLADVLPECVWTEEKKQQFKDDMIANVDDVWSGQHELWNFYDDPNLDPGYAPSWEDVHADPKFVVNPVDKGGHFKVTVLALPKADSLRSHVSSDDHAPETPWSENRASPDRKTKGAEVSDDDFEQTTAQFNSHDNDLSKISSSFDGNTYTTVAGDTLGGIALKLLGDASQWKVLYKANKALVTEDPDAAVTVGTVLTLKLPKTEQHTTAHEFGHMIGLDDQYLNGGGGKQTSGSVNDDGSKTSTIPAEEHRIMDGGEEVLSEHYSSVVEALNAAAPPCDFVAM